MRLLPFALLILFSMATIIASVSHVAPASAEGGIVILSNTLYQTYGFRPFSASKGDYLVAGEVKSVGNQSNHFNTTGTFYDSTDRIVGTVVLSDTLSDRVPAYLYVVLPGKNPPLPCICYDLMKRLVFSG